MANYVKVAHLFLAKRFSSSWSWCEVKCVLCLLCLLLFLPSPSWSSWELSPSSLSLASGVLSSTVLASPGCMLLSLQSPFKSCFSSSSANKTRCCLFQLERTSYFPSQNVTCEAANCGCQYWSLCVRGTEMSPTIVYCPFRNSLKFRCLVHEHWVYLSPRKAHFDYFCSKFDATLSGSSCTTAKSYCTI